MKKIVVVFCLSCWVFLAFKAEGADLYLRKNLVIENPINWAQIRKIKEMPREASFRPGHKIVCIFIFHPAANDESVRIEWIGPYGKTEQVYTHTISKDEKKAGGEYVVHSWLSVDGSFSDKLMGNKLAGAWRVKALFNGTQTVEREFTVYHD